jgi:hypothetical protein
MAARLDLSARACAAWNSLFASFLSDATRAPLLRAMSS